MKDTIEFELGQMVLHRAEGPDYESKGIVTAIIFRDSGCNFGVTWNDFLERQHWGTELLIYEENEKAVD